MKPKISAYALFCHHLSIYAEKNSPKKTECHFTLFKAQNNTDFFFTLHLGFIYLYRL